ncbi:MAG: hypothetical protein ACYS7M_02715, partial [Planctomycetota bacterium]
TPSSDKPTGEDNNQELDALRGKTAAGPAAVVTAKPPKPPTAPPVPQVAPKTPSQNALLSKRAPKTTGMPTGVPDLTKRAITTVRGGPIGRFTANILGRFNPPAKAAGLPPQPSVGSNSGMLAGGPRTLDPDDLGSSRRNQAMTTKSAGPVMGLDMPAGGLGTPALSAAVKPPVAPKPAGPSPMLPPSGPQPSPMAPPDVPGGAAPNLPPAAGQPNLNPFQGAQNFAAGLAGGAKELGGNLPRMPVPALPGPAGLPAQLTSMLAGGAKPEPSAGPTGGGEDPYQGSPFLDWAPKLLGMDYQNMHPILKGVLSIGGPVLLLLLLTKLFGKAGAYTPEQSAAAGDAFDKLSNGARAALWAEARARHDELMKLGCSMAVRYSKTKKVKHAAVPAPLATAPRFSRTRKPAPPKKPGQFPPGNRFQGAKLAGDLAARTIETVMDKHGTWATRNGKRVHVKHRKRRKKHSAYEERVIQRFKDAIARDEVIPFRVVMNREKQSQGLLGALIGSGAGAGAAPERRRAEGALRGAGIGLGTGLGAMGGMALGNALPGRGPLSALLSALLGLGGAVGGGYGGYRLGKHFLWPKHWARMRAAQKARRPQADRLAAQDEEAALRDELVAKGAAVKEAYRP